MTESVDWRRESEREQREAENAEPTELVQKLAGEMEMLRVKIDGITDTLSGIKSRYEEVRRTELPDAMRAAGMVGGDGKGSFSTASGAKVHLRSDLHVNVKAENKAVLISQLRDMGYGDIVREDVHYQTLKSLCKELLSEGKAVPSSVTTFPETTAVIKLPKTK